MPKEPLDWNDGLKILEQLSADPARLSEFRAKFYDITPGVRSFVMRDIMGWNTQPLSYGLIQEMVKETELINIAAAYVGLRRGGRTALEIEEGGEVFFFSREQLETDLHRSMSKDRNQNLRILGRHEILGLQPEEVPTIEFLKSFLRVS